MDRSDQIQIWVVFRNEWKEFFHHRRTLMIVPVLFIGIFLVVWSNEVAPFLLAVAISAFPAMEIEFNNIFYRTPAELEALGLLPVRWRNIVIGKNLAVIALSLTLIVPITVILANFSPTLIDGGDLFNLMLYMTSIIFPLIETGNIQSLQNPRRVAGWQYEDMMEVLWMTFTLLIVSIPAIIIMDSGYGAWPLFAYSLLMAWVWWYRSIPATARKLEQEYSTITERL